MYLYIPSLKSGLLSQTHSSHLHSLHPKLGDIYTFTNLDGSFAKAKIVEINKKLGEYKLEFLEIETQIKPPEKILFQHQTDKLYLEKLAELAPIAAVTKIYIYNGSFSPKQNVQTERLNKILIRSCEQSHNLFIPEIEILDKKTWLEKIQEHKPKWLHQEIKSQEESQVKKHPYLGVKPLDMAVVPVAAKLASHKLNNSEDSTIQTKPTSCLAGPEGGFSQKEEEIYNNLKLERVQLGQNILPAWVAGYTFFAKGLE